MELVHMSGNMIITGPAIPMSTHLTADPIGPNGSQI